jgi:predicted transposase/invertase (TIGR01784 family)
MATPPKRTLVSFDWAAKKLLRNKANFDILEGFLTTLLKQEIKVISILESETNREDESDKFNRVDLLVENQHGELIVIEIQNNRELHYLQRMLYGASKLIVDHLQLGESYANVKKVISISILYFLLGEGESDYVYHGNTEFYGLHDKSRLVLKPQQRQALFDGISSVNGNIFPEYYLIEVERFQDAIESDLDEWIYFFKNSEIREDFQAKNIQLAKEKLDLLKMPEKERRAYERYLMNKASERDVIETAKLEGWEEGFEQGEEKGEEKGIEKGEEKRSIEIAKMMLANDEPVDKIARYTGLSKKKIVQIKADI